MAHIKLSPAQKQYNKIKRQEEKKAVEEQQRIEREKNQKKVKSIRIAIEWKKSKTWGHNPSCEAYVVFQDGSSQSSPTFRCSGSGYDKESTVIADVFNMYLKYKLWEIPAAEFESKDRDVIPYGIHLYSKDRPHYGGGIGTNCYYDISKKIGGKFESIAHGKTFDVYTYTDND